MDLVRYIKDNNEMINIMNDACVALIKAGVVPGVNTDSHNSTKKDISAFYISIPPKPTKYYPSIGYTENFVCARSEKCSTELKKN